MKKYIFSLLALLLCYQQNSFFSQSFCKTPSVSENIGYNKSFQTEIKDGFYAPSTLRVYFHVIRRTNGSGGYFPHEVRNSFDILQEDFNPHGIYFAWDGCIDYIDNDLYFNTFFIDDAIYNVNKHQDGIDIYLFPASNSNNGGKANGIGNETQFWVAGTWGAAGPTALNRVISHEMGHVLFLWHTHHGTITEGGGDPGQCTELANGTNCAYCGDYVCDTPADPFIGFNVDGQCNWLDSGNDQNGDPYDPDTRIIMAYTEVACMQHFTPGQGQRMQQAINTLPVLMKCRVSSPIATEHCNCPPADIVIDQNTVIDHDLYVTGDIRIINGAQLTIKASVLFRPNRGIDMFENSKLIVDNGVLSSCDDLWRGIRVVGGNSDFDVKFTNNSIVENTSHAAVSMFPPISWPQAGQFGNGILHADHTSFNNTRRIVEFMSWAPKSNTSFIRHCVQNGGKWCITNWNCQGIEVSDNYFYNITADCIVSETGSFTITKNEFNSVDNDILFNNVSASVSSIINCNRLKGQRIGYNARGTTFAQNDIFNNKFQNGFLDILNDGHNNYRILHNTMISTLGAANIDNGAGLGDVNQNKMSGNYTGLLSIGINPNYRFTNNCFSSSFMDVYISGQVGMFMSGSGGIIPANNCFTHLGNTNSVVQDIGGNPDPFTYVEPNDLVVNCQDAILAHQNVIRLPRNYADIPFCREATCLPPGFTSCNPEMSYPSIFQSINANQSQITLIENDPSLNETQKSQAIIESRRCLDRAQRMLFELYIKDQRYTEARALYSNDPSNSMKVEIFSSYIFENNLVAARNYLNSLTDLSEEWNDFKFIQNINLDRLPLGPYYEVSSIHLATIKQIAEKSHSYSGYGKALYYVLTNEVISSQLPTFTNSLSERNNRVDINELNARIYPNPVKDVIQISLDQASFIEINIRDIFGNLVYSEKTSRTKITIGTENWKNGIFIVELHSNNKQIVKQKVLILN